MFKDLKKTKPRLASRAAPSPRNIAGRDVTMTPKLGYHPTNTKGVPWKKLIWLIWDMTPSCMCDIVCRKIVWSILYIYAKHDQFNRKTCDTKQLNWEHNLSTLKKQSNTHPKTTCIFQHKHDITLESLENQIRYPSCARKKGAPHEGPRAPGCPDHPRLSSDK